MLLAVDGSKESAWEKEEWGMMRLYQCDGGGGTVVDDRTAVQRSADSTNERCGE